MEQRLSYSKVESQVNDIVFSMILLLLDQVDVLSSSLDHLILSFKLLYIYDFENLSCLFGFLNDEILLHVLNNVVCDCPWTGPDTHRESAVSIDKAS